MIFLIFLSLLAGAVCACGWEEQPAEQAGSSCTGLVPSGPEACGGVFRVVCFVLAGGLLHGVTRWWV